MVTEFKLPLVDRLVTGSQYSDSTEEVLAKPSAPKKISKINKKCTHDSSNPKSANPHGELVCCYCRGVFHASCLKRGLEKWMAGQEKRNLIHLQDSIKKVLI